jgi:hypothetical protein
VQWHAVAPTIQQVMYASAVVVMMHRVMCAGVAARMIRWVMMQMTIMAEIAKAVVAAVQMTLLVMTVAAIVCARMTTAAYANRADPMTSSQVVADKDVDKVAVADAAVMTPPAMTVADKVAAATIRAKFRVAGRLWRDSYFPGPFDLWVNPNLFFLILRPVT